MMGHRQRSGQERLPPLAGLIALSPIAIEVVRRIDALFEIERCINGQTAQERLEFGRS
jgi:hypothetical protein